MDNVIPSVSVCCLTYNHSQYIRQCLDGFVMQKTTFPVEVLIHDDASTDGTQDIIREYECKYPDLIKPIYQTENQYSKGVKVSLVYNYSRVRGKYVALCEGDDYWTDPYKLQKQVDFLESHPDYVMCSHRFDRYFEDEHRMEKKQDETFHGMDYDLSTLVVGCYYSQTLSVIFRWSALDLTIYRKFKIQQDVVLFYHLLKKGKGYCFPDVMGVYRVHSKGIWSSATFNEQRLIEFKQRLDIYRVEQSDDAALFILSQFAKAMSRSWMLEQWRMMIKVFRILRKHYKREFVNSLLFHKVILGKGLQWDDLLYADRYLISK